MTNSMTAFSSYEITGEWGTGFWEIYTFNHRYLDICINLPKNFSSLSWIIRKKIKDHLVRGRIECNLQLDISSCNNDVLIVNNNLLKFLIDSVKKIGFQFSNESKANIDLVKILRYPGVISHKYCAMNDIHSLLLASFEKTLIELTKHRKQEGACLQAGILDQLVCISEMVNTIRQFIPEILDQKREKLIEQVQKNKNVFSNINSVRLEQELLIITQKMDITEEVDRLVIHINSIRTLLLSSSQSIGKKLNFIVQELHREANTIAAKSIDIKVINLAISLKVLIEQVREQAQNIE